MAGTGEVQPSGEESFKAPMPRPDDGTPVRPVPTIATVAPRAALDWLARGWADLRGTRFAGLFYGATFVGMGLAIVWVYDTRWQLVTGLIGGFFLMGPFVCAGLYELSRQRARGEPISLFASIGCVRRNPGSIALFAVLLTVLMIAWARVSLLLFALFSGSVALPSLQGVIGSVVSLENAGFVVLWFGIGLLFAALVFACGAIAVPMMLDRDSHTLEAVFTSVRALMHNPRPMLGWAVLVVAVIGTSLLLGFLPLLITAPLIGHATWHAYTDLVEPTGTDGRAALADGSAAAT